MRVSPDHVAILGRAEFNGSRLVLKEQLDRKTYEAIGKVIVAAGGKWVRKEAAHVFAGDAAEALESVFAFGEIRSERDEYQFFETPFAVASDLIRLAELDVGMKVLEPSAGRGAIAGPLRNAGVDVSCIELQPDNARVLTDLGFDVEVADFLKVPPFPVFDRVVANVPFARGAEVHHVTHALRFLSPRGRLISVMSAGVTFRSDRLYAGFRDLVSARGGSITPLPEGSFKASGTMVNTVVVVIPAA